MPSKPVQSSKQGNMVKNQIESKTKHNITLQNDCAKMPIAVVGVGALFPGSIEAGGFWRDILAGKNHVKEVPPTHFFIDDYFDENMMAPDKTYCRTGAFLSEVEFDPMEFGIPPTNLASTDTSQLLGLIVAKQVLNDATNGQFKNMDRSRVSVILGVAAGLELMGEMVNRLGRPVQTKALREEGIPEDKIEAICDRIANSCTPWKESTFPGLLGNVVAGRIANHFDLGGINCTSDAACASSFSAMGSAISELRLGYSDLVITGGADTNNDAFLFVSFSKTPALSPTHDIRPFSDKADGMILGEGIGMIALKRLEDAERDGDRIYAVIKGIGASSDGSGTSIYSPVAEGQALALKRAYENAGYSPDTVELVEAHGTGTKAGDATEFKGLSMVFNEPGRKDRQWCALGSVKSQIGHTKSSAAAAGIIKAIMAVHHKILPPTIKVDRPDPKLKIDESPFYLNTISRPWVKNRNYPRRASISSFGFGGTNFHVTLEEYEGKGNRAWRMRTSPSELLIYSAKDVNNIFEKIKDTREALKQEKGMLLYLARTSQENFQADLPLKLAIVASDEDDLEKKLQLANEKLAEKSDAALSLPSGVYYSNNEKPGKTAFIFPGQGSQYVNMGADLAMQFYDFQDVWDLTETISWNDGKDRLADKVFPVPVFSDEDRAKQTQTLTQTLWAQPTILTTSLAMTNLLGKLGIKPDCVGGHSLGEITAMYDAGILDMKDLLDICRERSSLMAKAAQKKGSMTAVIASIDKVMALLEEAKTDVVVANHNSPEQVVISGPTESIDAVEKRLKEEKIRFTRLPVSAAFHSKLMSESCKPFLSYLKKKPLKNPVIPFYSCVKGEPHPQKPDKIADLLSQQLDHPVRFVELILSMYDNGVRTFLEVGPSPVLTGLVGKILKGKDVKTINMDVKKEHGMTGFLKALGQLAVTGAAINFNYLWENYAPCPDPRQRKKPKISISLLGCNYNRPYPPKEGLAAIPKPNPKSTEMPAVKVDQAVQPNTTSDNTQLNRMEFSKMNSKLASKPSSQQSDAAPPSFHNPSPGMPNEKPNTPVTGRSHYSGPKQYQVADDSWVNAFHDIQRQTAEAHLAYQKSIADSHMAFLKTAEASTLSIAQMLSGQPVIESFQTGMPSYLKEESPPAVYTEQISRPQASMPAEMQKPAPVQKKPAAVELPPMMPAVKQEPEAPATGIPAGIDFKERLLSIVAEKTGYPKEILGEDMGLESDLGIDSIKRVEILSAVKDESPWLPEVDPSEMANIETLGDVIKFIEKAAPKIVAQTPSSSAVALPAAPAATGGIPAGIDFKEMLLSIVADKTGYPKEILSEDMGLESDLGIDSIKRVEILSAVKDESPWLPEVDPSEMANIETLGDVIRYIEKAAPAIASSAPQIATPVQTQTLPPQAPSGTAGIPIGIDFKEMLLSIVAEKTGYPKDILTEDMGLESDLGIDSIKRVEILSAVKDESPWLPEVDPSEMANIETLKDVIDYIEKMAPSVSATVPAQEQPVPIVAEITKPASGIPDAIDFTDMLLTIVAEKTGYPKDILTMDMGLEADLGIDSIKRVEILSAVKDESPWLPEIDPSEMANIETLKDVVDYIQKTVPSLMQGGGSPDSQTGSASPAPDTEDQGPKLGRYALRQVKAPFSGFAMKGLFASRCIAITDDGNGVAKELEKRLRKRNINATAVKSLPEDADGLIFLGGLKKTASLDEALLINREAFLFAKQMAPRFSKSGSIFVTVQDTQGDFGLSGNSKNRFWLSGLTGLVKTAAIEWLDVAVKSIDIHTEKKSPKEIAKEIAKELLAGGPEIEVGIESDGTRTRLESFEKAVHPSESMIDKKSVILASGGARGVTAKTLIALARETKCGLVLLGRTELTEEPECCSWALNDSDLKKALLEDAKANGRKITPAELGRNASRILGMREIKSTLNLIEEAGSRVRYVTADVQDEKAISEELKKIRKEWGPVTGIIHGAGVLNDKLIADKTPEQFDLVFNTKVRGLSTLLSATKKDPLTVICLFSSVAARFGNMGQCDYAMANEILNKVANHEAKRRKGACVVKSINWGPWDGGMVSPLLKDHFKKMGIPLIPIDTGAKNLVEEVQEKNPDHTEIVIGPKPPKAGLSIRTVETGINLSIPLREKNYPFLNSHMIKDIPVVPAVLVLEWFTRAAHIFNPDLVISACKDLRIYKGIKLDNFGKNNTSLTLNCRQISNGDNSILSLELPGENGAPYYTATIEMTKPDALERGAVLSADERASGNWPFKLSEIYKKWLFHGPDLQVIKALSGLSDTNASAVIAGIKTMKWPGDFWKTDAAALDGGLQLAILWGAHKTGRISLPTKIGAYVSHCEGAFDTNVRCELLGRLAGNDRTVSDILFFDDNNKIMAELRDVEMHMLPDSK
ncbi:MAG: SDR family oxidoreductase [Proteobacteria bacterium]|nr:SDR family oxidoreductase [Pseudomonadota bacterium]